jgi:urease accessory protein UreF
VDRLLSATKLSRELRAASSSTGRRFLTSVAAPVLGFGVEEALRAYLYSGVASLVAAGQKLVPLGGNVAQRCLFELLGGIQAAVVRSAGLEVEEMRAFAPTVDARSMLHERQRTRLYIS